MRYLVLKVVTLAYGLESNGSLQELHGMTFQNAILLNVICSWQQMDCWGGHAIHFGIFICL
jgi:hypothetical protein